LFNISKGAKKRESRDFFKRWPVLFGRGLYKVLEGIEKPTHLGSHWRGFGETVFTCNKGDGVSDGLWGRSKLWFGESNLSIQRLEKKPSWEVLVRPLLQVAVKGAKEGKRPQQDVKSPNVKRNLVREKSG